MYIHTHIYTHIHTHICMKNEIPTWLSACFSKKAPPEAAVFSGKALVELRGAMLSPIPGSQPGNTQHEERLHEFCHSRCSDILVFGEVGGRETFHLPEE